MSKRFWRRFLKSVNVFLLFRYYIPMLFSHFIYLNKLESQSPKDALYHVEIGQVILEKKMKMWNLYRHMDDSQETIRKVYCTWAFCTGELKTHFCLYHPSLEKQLTRHCCNSLQWWWQINCLCASFAASSVTGFLIWSISLHD